MSVLPFVRGVDFTKNDFSATFPGSMRQMSRVQWLTLDRTQLAEIPEELGHLQKLEHLSLNHNRLEKIFGELTELSCLRSLDLRHNQLKNSGIPPELFHLEELTTLDMSHNKLKEVPEGLERAKNLIVLNLSNNQIESIPTPLFIHLTDLLFLDLSHNRLETLPPQTRRLINLKTLDLSHNPLELFQLRQLPSLQSLEVLKMSGTQRTLLNFPTSLDSLANLCELDLSHNSLPKLPDCVYNVVTLVRLNLSDNELTELSSGVELWQRLESLNLSRNQLVALPAALCKLPKLRRLLVNDNKLNFEGIPSGIGKLGALEVFSAANNLLEMVPEGLCRCGALKQLNLSCNRLITLPDAIHLLEGLDQLDLRNNPELVMPPKPSETSKATSLEFYNIDFSLQTQLRLAGAAVPPSMPSSATPKDSTARKIRLRRGPRSEGDQDAAKVLKGMKDVAKDKDNDAGALPEDGKPESLKPKRWDESLEKPQLDYSKFFEKDDGQLPGLTIWEIENFLPNKIEEVVHGKFYEGDCYIVLKTKFDDLGLLDWEIFFWIGNEATLDKRACAAIHAVNLRNFLGARCRTVREEQGDESEQFLALFETEVIYIEGGRTATGFYTIEEMIHITRLYLVHAYGATIHLEPVAPSVASLDPRHAFVLDLGTHIYIWMGERSKNTLNSKARLMAEKISKTERKNKCEIQLERQGEESPEFWQGLDMTPEEAAAAEPPKEHVPEDYQPVQPRLYQVQLGMGYLELPQVELPEQKLCHTLLNSKHVYILDCYTDLFVWFGKKSTRLVRAAAVKLSRELFNMMDRPEYALVMRVPEGNEMQIFRTKFAGWDEVMAVDFTRTAKSVAKTGANLTQWARQQETRTDLAALFMPRQSAMPLAEAEQLEEEWNYDLEMMEAFVLENKKFVRLPEEELGRFYTGECYVFLCRYCIPIEEPENGPEDGANPVADDSKSSANNQPEDEIQCVVYFWQGRNAGNMGWLTFTFTLQKKFKAMFGEELEVVRIFQQQENLKFMSHFKRKFIIHTGKRKDKALTAKGKSPVEFFHLRSNGGALTTRLIQINPDAVHLNSAFCYILHVPFETEDDSQSGIVYVWIGSKACNEEAKLVQDIAEQMFNSPWVSLQILNEGDEPENFFWVALGGSKPYDTDAEYMNYTRLFRCSNERGYYTVAEKCADFCQDDLADDDIMILDNGEHVFLWMGPRCSEVEVKLAYKSAQVYIQHMRIKQPERPRKLFLTMKNKESRRFTKCFHGWSAFKVYL
ncbi:protein flightless-1 isoform X1 [Drosophila santomea]|uniref:protein flightless-1 isoform X1 n=1 Tax=Drosophila santomea TaxID=129105 RepID=UPI001954726B|nr:protein flightless-1 isoform X1 [Drosophila santomea]